MDRFASLAPVLEQRSSNRKIRRLLQEAVEKLPDAYRTIARNRVWSWNNRDGSRRGCISIKAPDSSHFRETRLFHGRPT